MRTTILPLVGRQTSSKPRGIFCSNFPAKIEPFVDKVRGQSEKYYEALTDSARVAQIGFNWTLDMERYCTVLKRRSGNNKLLKRGSSNTKLLNEYVKLMREGARNAQQQAEQLSGKFLRVSAGLRQVSRSSFLCLIKCLIVIIFDLDRNRLEKSSRIVGPNH